MTVRQALGPGGPFYRSHAAGRQVQSRLEAEGKILPHIKYNQEGYNMNEFLPKELKDYIAQNPVSYTHLSMAVSKSISSEACIIFSSSMERTGSYFPFKKSRVWATAFPYSSWEIYPWQGAWHCLMW